MFSFFFSSFLVPTTLPVNELKEEKREAYSQQWKAIDKLKNVYKLFVNLGNG